MKKAYLIIFLLTLCLVSTAFAAGKSFKASLSGKEVVPPVETKARGEVDFKLSKDGNELSYKLHVDKIENVTGAHIHEGKKGATGHHVATLFAGPKKEGKFSGNLSKGKIAASNLEGSLKGKTVGDLVKMIKDGNAYVNVHSVKNPDGEIRGQIK